MNGARRRRWFHHERRVLLMALAAGLPGVLVSLALLWTGDHAPRTAWTLTTLVLACWLGLSFSLRSRVVYPL
jgi:hypothetical protein